MADKNTTLNTDTILEDIKKILNEKGTFCSEEEFRYWFISENHATQNGNKNYSLEYPFKYKKIHNTQVDKDNAKVDAILWDPKDPKHGLYAFEFKYAHRKFDDTHGRHINKQDPTINIRYDFLEDIDRLESLFDDNNDIHINVGYAIFLTNIRAYRTPAKEGTKVSEVSIEEGAAYSPAQNICVSGNSNDKYYKPLVFRSKYKIHWEKINDRGFYCCIVEVKRSEK